ncbi:MAG: hypothetical protein QOF28_2865 [Actinomycetota bacterium]|jgi:hypothetical protein|nr:hypothetical protein [Actinomycetota bacterium]
MTNDRDTDLLGSELHDLVDGIAPDRGAGMQRAQRAIARRARNRRLSAGAAGAAVALVAATVFVVVDRADRDATVGPAATTTQSSAPTSSTTVPSPTTRATLPGSPIESALPELSQIPAAKAAYSKTFPWGAADDEVAFHTPQGEGASGGPLAFTATGYGDIQMLDHSTSRIVRFYHGVSSATHIALASPAVTAAAFDGNGHVIVATIGDLAEFGPDGARLGNWPGISPVAITELSIVNDFVYSVTDHSTRTPLLRQIGPNFTYSRLFNTVPEPIPVTVDNNKARLVTFTVTASRREYRITTSDTFVGVPTTRLLPDGTLVFVLQLPSTDSGQSPDAPTTYVLVRIDPDGGTHYETIAASGGYLVNGPEFVINGDAIAVMGSTTSGGVTVSYYPFD